MNKLDINPFYNSIKDNILLDFYIPVLSKTKIYKRVSAYFDSNIIALYSKGIENIVNQNGHIYFIFSNELNERDYNIIKNSYEERERLFYELKKRVITDVSSVELKNLGYLIKHNYVDIKIAFTKSTGIFHDKFGLCEDDDNTIYFRGSNNETVASIQSNFESFETTCSWIANDRELSKVQNAKKVFDDLWNNKFSEDVLVLDMPDIIKNQLISYASDRLIYTVDNYKNQVIIDYFNRVIIINNLDNPSLLLPQFSFYKRVLDGFVEKIASNEYHLFDNLNYILIKRIISDISDYSTKHKFSIFLTNNIIKYLEDKDIMIEKRRSLGIAIKERMKVLDNDFKKFCDVIKVKMVRNLRTPQLWDAYHIAKMMRSANFSVPGSGKTSIVYGAFAYLESIGEIEKIVMVGPISSFSSWINEFKLCFGSKKNLNVFDYQKEKNTNALDRFNRIVFDAPQKNLILFNYESLQTNVDALISLIDSKTLLVFDEVHRIKSVTGIRAHSARKIGVNAKYRVVLTGTPIPNGYIDLFNMLNILFTDEYDTFFAFDEHYLNIAKNDFEKQNIINNAIYPFFCRTNKDDLKVPKAEPDNIEDGYCIVNEKEERLFEIIYRGFSHSIFALYIRLIQAANNPKLILKKLEKSEIKLFNTEDYTDDFTKHQINEAHNLTEKDKEFIKSFDMSSKFFTGINLVERLVENGKVLVWGIFIDTLHRIKEELMSKGIKSEVITGSTPLCDREEIINHFMYGDIDVLITNPHTLGESVSLHKTCHQAVYFEYSFNLVHMLQSKDRIHRLGLKENEKTFYYYLMLDNPNSIYTPIDMNIYKRLLEKEKLQANALSAKSVSYVPEDLIEDLNSIFNGKLQ
ncbi:MAG TPA: DEAD/DEAH box helicase family protein [Gallicola sp.]|nr:DEAD/DEAH box helicase family protein [Gallicola sp.]